MGTIYAPENCSHLKLDIVVVTAEDTPTLVIDFSLSVPVPEWEPWIEAIEEKKGGQHQLYQPIRADVTILCSWPTSRHQPFIQTPCERTRESQNLFKNHSSYAT